MTPQKPTYFDHYQSRNTAGEPLAIGGFNPLDSVYAYEPIPPELEAGDNFRLGHYGLGVVIHPNTTIGRNVFLGHQVTLGTDIDLRDPRRMTTGDDVNVGVGAIVLGPVTIGRGAVIGAGAVVTHDVPADTVVIGVPARPLG